MSVIISFVYAKCNVSKGQHVWASLMDVAFAVSNSPWMIGGDFNVISEASKRIGNLNFNYEASHYFSSIISNASLMNIGFSGSKST